MVYVNRMIHAVSTTFWYRSNGLWKSFWSERRVRENASHKCFEDGRFVSHLRCSGPESACSQPFGLG
jgi:hypothetical protein